MLPVYDQSLICMQLHHNNIARTNMVSIWNWPIDEPGTPRSISIFGGLWKSAVVENQLNKFTLKHRTERKPRGNRKLWGLNVSFVFLDYNCLAVHRTVYNISRERQMETNADISLWVINLPDLDANMMNTLGVYTTTLTNVILSETRFSLKANLGIQLTNS